MPDSQESEDATAELSRKVELAIWNAMSTLAAISQTTAGQSSHAVQIKIVQLDAKQTVYTPVQVYQERHKIAERVRPWQEILMFFIRTQQEHSWQSPKYVFGAVQRAYFEEMLTLARAEVEDSGIQSDTESGQAEHLNPLQQAVLKFCIELLNQRMVSHEYNMALVCASAVLGIRHVDRSWQSANSYPPILSRIIKVAQLMVIQYAAGIVAENSPEEDDHVQRSWDISSYEPTGSNSEAFSLTSSQLSKRRRLDVPEFEIRSIVALIKGMVESLMQRGTEGPMEWFLDLRAYGMKIHFANTVEGHVNWRNSTTLEYKAITFSMFDFQSMIHQLTKTTKILLFEEVLQVDCDNYDSIPAIPWQQVYDDPSNSAESWSFLDDQRTRLPVDGTTWFLKHMKTAGKKQQMVDVSAREFRESKMRDWLRQVANFRAKLLVLMHMTRGQPARGPGYY